MEDGGRWRDEQASQPANDFPPKANKLHFAPYLPNQANQLSLPLFILTFLTFFQKPIR